MLTIGALSFAAPWMLAALATLPVIWWLLKVHPPAPRRILFPAVRLLFGLRQSEETPVKTPLWLILLRLLLAILAILALAHPLLNPAPRLGGDGPLMLVVDDGWAAAAHWDARQAELGALIEQAEREQRGVVLATTAPRAATAAAAGGQAAPIAGPMPAGEARKLAQALKPKPWGVDRGALAEAIQTLRVEGDAHIAWLSDGLADASAEGDRMLTESLRRFGEIRLYGRDQDGLAHVLLPPASGAAELVLRAARAVAGAPASISVRATAADGRHIARQTMTFAADSRTIEQALTIPVELRNEVMRLDIDGESSAGATVLLDERWRRRPAGLVSGGGLEANQPLLADLYYLERAIGPFSEIRRGTVAELIDSGLSVLVLADVGRLPEPDRARIESWIGDGGVLIRFAGPRLADGVDELVPVRLRASGGRALGGALSWEQPKPLAEFGASTPFAGLAVPGDVLVHRQVLAEPSLELESRSWAKLTDGTPVVTAERRGQGWVVLFHITANADWSNLPLSGLFVAMLQRLAELGEGIAGEAAGHSLPALLTLDGFGQLGEPAAEAVPIAAKDFTATAVGPRHPPGFYGNDLQRRALNLGASVGSPQPLAPVAGVIEARYGARDEIDLKPALLIAVVMIALVDGIVGLGLRGLLPALARAGAALVALAVMATLAGPGAEAQTADDQEAILATREVRFAYVVTGEDSVDRTSHAGLNGLSMVLRQRTSVEPGEPKGIDPEQDELVFYPLIYWPVTETQTPLSVSGVGRIDAYLRTGGMILFDARDQSPRQRLDGGGGGVLGNLLSGLNLPPLIPVPVDHALSRSFYLIDNFPGRWDGGKVWVERYEGDVNDGVSSVVIGGNDWAAAWALDGSGVPLFPVVPGGERQREMAFRFGVNLALYALAGNYKADQVHIPAILRRLGRMPPGMPLDETQ